MRVKKNVFLKKNEMSSKFMVAPRCGARYGVASDGTRNDAYRVEEKLDFETITEPFIQRKWTNRTPVIAERKKLDTVTFSRGSTHAEFDRVPSEVLELSRGSDVLRDAIACISLLTGNEKTDSSILLSGGCYIIKRDKNVTIVALMEDPPTSDRSLDEENITSDCVDDLLRERMRIKITNDSAADVKRFSFSCYLI